MSEIKDDLQQLHTELNDALKLVSEFSGVSADRDVTLDHNLQIKETQSLLERCNEVVASGKGKTKLRIVHHMACSGGTLISKCLAALPNVFLLSELHPTTTLHQGGGKPKFLPSDVTTQARYAGVPDIEKLAWKIFKQNIRDTSSHIDSLGGDLVIREHTHSDFCVGAGFQPVSSVAHHLQIDFDLLRVATIRNPIDSYLSLQKNNWVHFTPSNFEEYCKRIWTFISEYRDEQIFRYEDFVSSPKEVFKKITRNLELTFSDDFLDTFDIFQVTGDSGRSGSEIAPRPRRPLNKEELDEINQSEHFQLIANKLNYNSIEKEVE